ncbi:hypothetical protein QZH41_012436, partial [Actinostola sp. cb2023]
FIMYLDTNNLYGWAMSQFLPVNNFGWLTEQEDTELQQHLMTLHDDGTEGYILEVNLSYPKELHDLHNDYPLAPERQKVTQDVLSPYCRQLMEDLKLNYTPTDKLVPNLNDKQLLHYRNLQQYLSLGMKLTKIHRVLGFDQSPWLKTYIDFNTEKRKQARNDFEKYFFKLMNNSVFGKTMENLRRRVSVKLVNTPKQLKKLTATSASLMKTWWPFISYLYFSCSPTVPPEILARGPQALRAYRKALTSGSTKNNQVLLMFIGQSRVGKTSLLRSLKGQQFNPNEDSTPGVKIDRSFSKQKGDQWLEEGHDELFDISTAYEVAGSLKSKENNGASSEKALVHQEREEKFFRDDVFEEDNEYSSNSIPSIARSASDDEVELVNTGREDCLAVPVEKEEKLQPSYTETTSEIQIPPIVIESVTKFLRNDRMEKDDYSYITFDFAGQPVYSATHPVFFSSKAIYILVYSLKDKLDDQANPIFKEGCYEKKLIDRCPMTNMDHIEFWLSFVQSASVQQEHDGSLDTNEDVNCLRHFQPVFLVGTHADKPFDNDKPANLAQKVFHRLEGKANADSQCLVRKSYTVNNQVSGSGQKDEDVKKLRDDILEEVKKLPYINEDIPIRWLRFKSELSFLVKSLKKRYLSLDEAKEIASKCTINGEDEFDTLLNYLHDLKNIIYFEDTKLVIIDIQWLLDVFVKVVTVQPYLDWDVKYKESWKKLEDDGILEKALVEHLWHDLVDEVNTIDSLLLIMERFSIICQWNDVYLVPSMLMNCDERGTDDLVGKNFKSPLVVLFKSPHLPLGIFPRLLVEMCKDKLWRHTPAQGQPQFFHNFCR